MTTANKSLYQPANGSNVNTWDVPLNANADYIDLAFGSVTLLNASAGSATLSLAQYRPLILDVSGAMSANVIYTIPTGVGGQWLVRNRTTGGSYTVTIAYQAGGPTLEVPRNATVPLYADTTTSPATYGIYASSVGVGATVPGSSTQVIFNNAGAYSASANFTWDGTTLAASNISTVGTITATGAITSSAAVTAFSDRSLKRDIQTIEHAVDLVKRMRGVSYEMINTGALGIGVIAQEMQEVIPQVVFDNNGILSIAYGNLTAVLIEAVKEMSARIDQLEGKTPV
jgi:Chaperone of endosialidase